MEDAQDARNDGADDARNRLTEGKTDLLLPRFIRRDGEGVFVDLRHLSDGTEFQRLIERLMAAGYLFRGLDYRAFCTLLFESPASAVQARVKSAAAAGREPLLRWADELASFEPQRAALYRNLQISGSEAHYLFEPLVIAEPAGENEDGSPATVERETALDFDEFVVQMWLKGVRAGLDEASIRRCIENRQFGREQIARSVPPTPGTDAAVRELWSGLRRDDTPRVLSDGRADLTQFSNRFPQVKAGVRLLCKVPPVPGTAGRNLRGEELAPAPPSDFALEDLAGAGTRVEREDGEQYLVAEIDGFVDIDAESNRISVSETIVNRQGVSVRTTGDLALMGDRYEEYGEIQERRTVEGRTITTHADVYGNLLSSGGEICVKKNLSGGSAVNRDGPIRVEGLAVNAWVHAPRGEIRIRRAEGCVLSGRQVVVEEAVACEIYGEQVRIADSRGCSIAGSEVAIAHAASRGAADTTIFMLLPASEGIDSEIERLAEEAEALKDVERRASEARRQLTALPEVARYVRLAGLVRSGEAVLTGEQKPAFDALARQAAPHLKVLGKLSDQAERLKSALEELAASRARLEEDKRKLGQGVRCVIDDIFPGVVVRTLLRKPGEPALGGLQAAQLKAALHAVDAGGEILARDRSGPFEWQLEPP